METMHWSMRVMAMVGSLLGATACAGGGEQTKDSASVSASAVQPAESAATGAGGSATGTASGTAAETPSGTAAATGSAATTSATGAATPATGSPRGSTASATTASGTAAATGAGAGATPAAASDSSAASGVFTAAQAARGREVYSTACATCHMTTQHSGGTFAATWNNRRVFDLYDLLYNTMPLDNPGGLTDQQYVDVVAYILQLNGHPAGKGVLQPDPAQLRKLRIDIRGAAAP